MTNFEYYVQHNNVFWLSETLLKAFLLKLVSAIFHLPRHSGALAFWLFFINTTLSLIGRNGKTPGYNNFHFAYQILFDTFFREKISRIVLMVVFVTSTNQWNVFNFGI